MQLINVISKIEKWMFRHSNDMLQLESHCYDTNEKLHVLGFVKTKNNSGFFN